MKKYVKTGQVYYEFVPLANLGPESLSTAKAAYCANDQGKFWEYTDILFANQNGENTGYFTNTRLTSFAQSLNLDAAAFSACLTSDKYDSKLNENHAYATENGIIATPMFLVNGTATDSGQLVQLIESALAK